MMLLNSVVLGTYLSARLDEGSLKETAFLMMKNIFKTLIFPFSSNMVAILYYTLCVRCCAYTKYLTQEIAQCPTKATKQVGILKQKGENGEYSDRYP
ncbi:hypothetical protein CEXT_262231 [Caerostris extrusa]|uniref:Uncharacterized protein n=1 Tax=Caerostris extrusa TaxID=172846 RepID=A0AAV4NJA3_CAEEX|nr:hypothetical protein CEXT_262231 [Caerostris extrusa]